MVNRRGRRSIRLPGFDYTQPGAYFVTICTHMRQDLFGVVIRGQVRLSSAGRIAARCWAQIPSFFPEITSDAWVVMPNHLHGIVIIGSRRGEAFGVEDPGIPAPGPLNASPLPSPARGTRPGSLASTIQNYKSVTARQINHMRRTPQRPGLAEELLRTCDPGRG